MAAISNQQNDTPDPHETFLRLWMVHEPQLRAFVRSCCPNAQEVDDVMQEVSIAALRKFSTLDDHAAFGPWACLIARYELLTARRRFARDRLVLAEDIVKLLADEGAEELPLRRRQLRALDQCVEKLPRQRRELALAAYGNDTTIRELAAQLKRTEGSLYQLLARIRMKLHRCMELTLAGDGS
jgi:RNA polymerase sigma-70 factor (ECF subfamily)